MKVFICCAVLCLVSGCTGIEIGGRLGIYRVDQQSSSSQTNVENKVPLRCYFVSCTELTNDLK